MRKVRSKNFDELISIDEVIILVMQGKSLKEISKIILNTEETVAVQGFNRLLRKYNLYSLLLLAKLARKRKHREQYSFDKIFIYDTPFSRAMVRRTIIRENLLPLRCAFDDCPSHQFVVWRDKKVPLQLDHISGDYKDNRLENLRFLCGICHQQTDTFAIGRHKDHPLARPRYCSKCKEPLANKKARVCRNCKDKNCLTWTIRDMPLEALLLISEGKNTYELATHFEVRERQLRFILFNKFGPDWGILLRMKTNRERDLAYYKEQGKSK